MLLTGKTAVVTGGAAGIGQEIVRLLSTEGARVISMDWDSSTEGGGDVSNANDVKRVFDAAGPVDILVNNAAFSKGDGLLLDVSEEVWDRTLAICLKGVFLCSKAALSSMVARRSGAIVNISSVNALTGIHLAAYTAAKGGIISLTRVLAAQYGRYGVRINTICPGTILSESSRVHYDANPEIARDLKSLYPAGAFGSTTDIAAAVLFLVSEQASFINGAIIPIDGGLTAVHQLPSVFKS